MQTELAEHAYFQVPTAPPTVPPAPSPRIRSGVGVVAIRDGRFLVCTRLAGADGGVGVLAVPGGKVEFGETIEHAAFRELLEETGLRGYPFEVAEGAGHVFHVGEHIGDGEHHISYYVAAEAPIGDPSNCEPRKHSDWRWVTLQEAEIAAEGRDSWLPLGALRRFRTSLGL